MTCSETGAFVISLDTELIWGTFDTGSSSEHRYKGTRQVIQNLLTLFDKHRIPVTWAIVTHLLTDCRHGRNPHAELASYHPDDADNWYHIIPCRTGLKERLWYEPQLVNWIRDAAVNHEIGSHTHTHPDLSEAVRETAQADVEKSVSRARSANVEPRSFIFPRNRINHRDVLREAGFDVYRGVDARWYETQKLPETGRKLSRFVDEATCSTPPTVVPRSVSGMVEIPGSQAFRPYHGGWQYTPNHSQRNRAIAGLNRAASTGEVFHLWFHPFNLAQEPNRLLAELDAVLDHAASLRARGELDVHTMACIADEYRNGRWNDDT